MASLLAIVEFCSSLVLAEAPNRRQLFVSLLICQDVLDSLQEYYIRCNKCNLITKESWTYGGASAIYKR